jgi:hypothetical protein
LALPPFTRDPHTDKGFHAGIALLLLLLLLLIHTSHSITISKDHQHCSEKARQERQMHAAGKLLDIAKFQPNAIFTT